MSEAWLDRCKLTPPAPPADLLPRALIPEGPLPPVVVLEAGPGYGKTLGLLTLQDRLPAGTPRVWLTLDAFDVDRVGVFGHLIAGLRGYIPQFGAELEALLAGDARPEPRILWRRFFTAVASYNLPCFVLALDDLHHLHAAQPELVAGLAENLGSLPEGQHVLLATRKALPLGLGSLQARGRAAVLGEDRLGFTPEEQASYMRLYAPDRDPALASAFEGWPLGLGLIARGRDPAWAQAHAAPEVLASLVARDHYAAQPPERQAFMLAASLLDAPTPEACDALVGSGQARAHLPALAEEHLVVALGGRDQPRFPTYMREFLRLEAARTLPVEELAALHQRAAGWHEAAARPELALPHRLAAQDWERARDAFLAVAPDWLLRGRQESVWRWLEAFPEQQRQLQPALALWQGQRLGRAGDYPAASEHYTRARDLAAGNGDLATELKALVRLCTAHHFLGDMPAAGRYMLAALALVSAGRPEDVADLQLLRGVAAEQRGDLGLMREVNEAVLALPVAGNGEVAACQAIAHLNLATQALHRGELDRAHFHVAEAQGLARVWEFVPTLLFADFMDAHLYHLRGQVDVAADILAAVPPYWADVLDWHEQGVAWAILGEHGLARGSWKEAEDALARSSAVFERAGYAEGKKVPLERQLWLAIARGQYARPELLLAGTPAPEEPGIHDLALRVPRARALHLAGEPTRALAELADTIPALERLEASLYLARAHLYEAAAQPDAEKARSAFDRARTLAVAGRYDFLPVLERETWEALERRLEARPAAAEPEPLDLRLFGRCEVYLGGQLVTRWQRTKPQLVLAALASYPRGLRLDELAARLGVESLTPAAIGTLQADISRLRKALEPQLAKGEDSRYVKLVDERYHLAWELVDLDTKRFEEALAVALDLRESSPVRAAARTREALALYRGHFMQDGLGARHFEAERESYRLQALAALDWLATFCAAHNDGLGAQEALNRAIALAPTDEDRYLALARYYVTWGPAERIRQVYWDCRKTLKAELGLPPSDAFEQAFKALAP